MCVAAQLLAAPLKSFLAAIYPIELVFWPS